MENSFPKVNKLTNLKYIDSIINRKQRLWYCRVSEENTLRLL